MSYKQQIQERSADNKMADFKTAFEGIDMSDLSIEDITLMLTKEFDMSAKDAKIAAKGLLK